jgi:hypothetical protein
MLRKLPVCHSASDEKASAEQAMGCNTCQVCHLSAFVSPACAAMLRSLPVAAPVFSSESFSSSEPLRLSKPPIS